MSSPWNSQNLEQSKADGIRSVLSPSVDCPLLYACIGSGYSLSVLCGLTLFFLTDAVFAPSGQRTWRVRISKGRWCKHFFFSFSVGIQLLFCWLLSHPVCLTGQDIRQLLFLHVCPLYGPLLAIVYCLPTVGVEPASNLATLLGPHNQSYQPSFGLMGKSRVFQHPGTHFNALQHLNPFFTKLQVRRQHLPTPTPKGKCDSQTVWHLFPKKSPHRYQYPLTKSLPISLFCVLKLTEAKS